jgi:deoxycytidine triphosphate deaminase
MSPAYVEMPEGTVGWLVTRSTLNRNGVFVLSGLYDSGYKGHINGMLYNRGGPMVMEKMSRVSQFIVGSSDSFGTYSGGYNTDEGILPEYIDE